MIQKTWRGYKERREYHTVSHTMALFTFLSKTLSSVVLLRAEPGFFEGGLGKLLVAKEAKLNHLVSGLIFNLGYNKGVVTPPPRPFPSGISCGISSLITVDIFHIRTFSR